MLAAMGITAALSIGIGVYPAPLYALLPFQVDFAPYTIEHVVTQLQLLIFSALAFTVLIRTGLYPPEMRSTNLDFDWSYRRLGHSLATAAVEAGSLVWQRLASGIEAGARRANARLHRHHGPEGVLGRTWPTGTMAFWTTVMLAAYLIVSYL